MVLVCSTNIRTSHQNLKVASATPACQAEQYRLLKQQVGSQDSVQIYQRSGDVAKLI